MQFFQTIFTAVKILACRILHIGIHTKLWHAREIKLASKSQLGMSAHLVLCGFFRNQFTYARATGGPAVPRKWGRTTLLLPRKWGVGGVKNLHMKKARRCWLLTSTDSKAPLGRINIVPSMTRRKGFTVAESFPGSRFWQLGKDTCGIWRWVWLVLTALALLGFWHEPTANHEKITYVVPRT